MQQADPALGDQERSPIERLMTGPLRILISLLVPLVTFVLMQQSFLFLRDSEAPKLVIAGVAILVGVGGVWALYYATDFTVNLFPEGFQGALRPFVFVGPALAILAFYLVLPALWTVYLSFMDARSENFVGLENYAFVFTDRAMLQAFRNNVLWLILVPSLSVAFGLVVALLADRVRWESLAKSIIFLPMAISFVGASVIWRFVYAFQPAGQPQYGLLNAIVTAFGGDPIGWLIQQPLNNIALIIILVWLQTGFAMVLISAAIKGVPGDILEAARMDGANEVQVFWNVIIPTIRPTLVTVSTTILILTLKIFDIVWVMTNGNFGTEVIASRMIKELFRFRDFGRGSAIAVILLVATIPIMWYNIRSFREEEKLR